MTCESPPLRVEKINDIKKKLVDDHNVQLTEQIRCPRTHARGRVDAMPSGGVHTTVSCRRSRIRDAGRRLMIWHASAERGRACHAR